MTERDPFTQLTGAFDLPVAPAPEFAARLRAQVVAELVAAKHTGSAAAGVHPVSGGEAMKEGSTMSVHANGDGQVVDLRTTIPTVVPHRAPMHRRAGRLLRWLPALEVAAALLLIMTLFGQLIGPETLRNAVIPDAFQPAQPDAARNTAMWRANPGRTGVMTDSAPNLNNAQPRVLVAGTATLATSTLVHGQRLFQSGYTIAQSPEPLLEAIETTTGETIWQIRGEGVEVYGHMAATSDTLLFIRAKHGTLAGDISGELVALDSANGTLRWTGPDFGDLLDNPLVSPIVVGTTVNMARHDGTLFAVDLATGDTLWQGGEPDPLFMDPNSINSYPLPGGMIAADDEVVYTALSDNTLEAYDHENGDVRWTADLSQSGTQLTRVSLAAHAGRVIALIHSALPTEGNPRALPVTVASFDAQTGDRIWSETMSMVVQEPVVLDDTIVVSMQEGRDLPARLLGLDPANGATRWEVRDGLAATLTSLSGAGNQIYVLGENGRLSLVEDGRIVHAWSLPASPDPLIQNTYSLPALLADDRLYIPRGDGTVLVLGAARRIPAPSPNVLPATAMASPDTPSDTSSLERSTLAGGSWTFDAAVPATAPGEPEVFPTTDEGATSFSADVEGDMLVRLVGVSPFEYGDLSVEAVSLTTGERRWIVPFENPSIPFIADGRVFINDGATVQSPTELAASIYALDLATGEVLWRVPFAGQAGEYPRYPVVVGSMLYVADAVGVIQAVDVESGQTQWQAPSGVEPALSAGGAPLVDLQSVPVADDKHVYILTADGTFRALDRETGQPVWQMPILGTYAAQIYNVNPLTDGTTIVLMISTFTEDSAATPALFSGPALTTVALDARDGRHLWQRDSNIDSMENGSGPVLVDGLFLTFGFGDASDGLRTLTALRDIDGTEAWQSDVIPYQSAWWSAGNNYALSTDANGALVALDLATGEEVWRVAMPPLQHASAPLITEDAIVVAGEDGRIVVWRTATAPASSLSGDDPVEPPLAATPSPVATPAGSLATPDANSSGRSTAAGGSWTFDVAVPGTSPGEPEVFPALDDGELVLAADVAGETLVRLVIPSLEQFASTSVEAVSLSTGEQRWIVPVPNAGAPIIADGRVFVFEVAYVRAGTERSVLALDLATGEEIWKVPFSGQPGEFSGHTLVVGSTLYVSDALGMVQALDVVSGQVRWKAPGGSIETAFDQAGEQLVSVQTSPVADGEHIYTHTADRVFRALDLETGEQAWSVPILGAYVDAAHFVAPMADGGPVVLDILAVPSFDSVNANATPADGDSTPMSVTVALDAATGRELWQRAGDADSEEGSGAELIGDDLVLGYGFDGMLDGLRPLVALNVRDGTEAWQSDVIPTQSTWWTMTLGHVVAIVPGGTLVAIDLATGEEAWRAAMPPMEPAIPALITEDKIVVIGHNGEIVVWRI